MFHEFRIDSICSLCGRELAPENVFRCILQGTLQRQIQVQSPEPVGARIHDGCWKITERAIRFENNTSMLAFFDCLGWLSEFLTPAPHKIETGTLDPDTYAIFGQQIPRPLDRKLHITQQRPVLPVEIFLRICFFLPDEETVALSTAARFEPPTKVWKQLAYKYNVNESIQQKVNIRRLVGNLLSGHLERTMNYRAVWDNAQFIDYCCKMPTEIMKPTPMLPADKYSIWLSKFEPATEVLIRIQDMEFVQFIFTRIGNYTVLCGVVLDGYHLGHLGNLSVSYDQRNRRIEKLSVTVTEHGITSIHAAPRDGSTEGPRADCIVSTLRIRDGSELAIRLDDEKVIGLGVILKTRKRKRQGH